MAELWVGAGEAFTRLKDAIAQAGNGDTIFIRAGVYENDFATINREISIIGVGGPVELRASVPIDNGKAILVTNADVTIENITFSGAKVTDQNGAGIRYQAGDLVIRNSLFINNENGILAAANPAGTITIENSEFAFNGFGDGRTHGVYVNQLAKLTITDSYFHDTKVGHHVKSRALETEITDSRLDDGAGNSSYSIDLPNGGNALIHGNTLIQGAAGQNRTMINYGGEAGTNPGALLIEDNVFVNFRAAGATGVSNRIANNVTLDDNTFVNVGSVLEGVGTISDSAAGRLAQSGVQAIVGTDALDMAVYANAPSGVSVNLAQGTGTDGFGSVDTLSNIEGLWGSRFADQLFGNAGANRLLGDFGNDTVSGDAGNDEIAGGRGNDSLAGGSGDDTLLGGSGDDTITSGTGNDVLIGGTGNDVYRADQAGDVMVEFAGGGIDTLRTTLASFDLATTPEIENLTVVGDGAIQGFGNAKANILTGWNANDVLDGRQGNDILRGNLGDDSLAGGEGNDTLAGGNGNDSLFGGAGADSMVGGLGADRFVFAPGGGNDVIADFRRVQGDRLDAAALGVNDLNDMSIVGNLITFADGSTVKVNGVTTLNASDFWW